MSDEPTNSLAQLAEQVPEGLRKRVAAAFLQIMIGTRKGAEMYRAGRDAMDAAEGRSIVTRELANAVAKQAVDDPEIMERAKARFLGDLLTKQENVEAVMASAGQLLLTGPSSPAASAENAVPHGAEEGLDLEPEWVEAFTREAEKASTQGLRDRLSRILAGEIAEPGTYHRSIFRTIVELDKRDIQNIRTAIPARAGNAIYLGLISNIDMEKIETDLIEAGLIDTSRFSHGGFVLKGSRAEIPFDTLPVGDFCLAIESVEPHLAKGETLILNRAGAAAFDLIDDAQQDAPARRFAQLIASPVMRITLCSMKREPDGSGFHYEGLELLHIGSQFPGRQQR